MIGLPGFAAELALFHPSQPYRASMSPNVVGVAGVQPQLPKGSGSGGSSVCAARCLGAYIGSSVACIVDPYPDICASIAGNVYNRCLAKCSFFGFSGSDGWGIA
jgi:hypothetical protein